MEQMKLAEKHRDAAWALEQFRQCEYAVLAINHEGHPPYQVQMCVVVLGQSIYFHSALEGLKSHLMEKNAQISLSCVSWTKSRPESFTLLFRSAFAMGTADLIEDYDEKYRSMMAFGEKYVPAQDLHYMADRIASGRALVYRLDPDFMVGKESTEEHY